MYKILKIIIFMTLILISGCSNPLSEEEFNTFVEDYNHLVEITSKKVIDRADDVIRYGDNVRNDEEVSILVNKLDEMIDETKERIPKNSVELFNEMKDVQNNLYMLENENISSNFSETNIEELKGNILAYSDEFIETSQSNSADLVAEFLNSTNEFSDDEIEKFKNENGLNLTSTDVQYDLANNVAKEFFITGEAELDDYFNYGFENEKDYFSVSVIPSGEGYTNRWNLYFHRESFNKLYNELKDGKVEIMAVLEIPTYLYKEGQGNMANVNRATWR